MTKPRINSDSRQASPPSRRWFALLRLFVRQLYSATMQICFAYRRATNGDPKQLRILLVRTDTIGDFVLFTPALKYIRKRFNKYRISAIVSKDVAPLARTCPYLDEILIWERSRYSWDITHRFRFMKRIRSRQFQVAVYPVRSREAYGDELLYCSGASQKIAIAGDSNNISPRQRRHNDRLFTRLIPDSQFSSTELEFNRQFVGSLTGIAVPRDEFQTELWIGESRLESAREILDDYGIHPNTDLVVAVFPSASWHGKMWPTPNFARLVDRLAETYGAKILIVGGPKDVHVAAAVHARAKAKGSAVNLAGTLELVEMAALLKLCALFLGNDSGPTHMAIALNIPTLCIVGGGHFGRFHPYGKPKRHRIVHRQMDCYGCNWQCIYQSIRCIQEISVDEVWRQTQSILEEEVLPVSRCTVARSTILTDEAI